MLTEPQGTEEISPSSHWYYNQTSFQVFVCQKWVLWSLLRYRKHPLLFFSCNSFLTEVFWCLFKQGALSQNLWRYCEEWGYLGVWADEVLSNIVVRILVSLQHFTSFSSLEAFWMLSLKNSFCQAVPANSWWLKAGHLLLEVSWWQLLSETSKGVSRCCRVRKLMHWAFLVLVVGSWWSGELFSLFCLSVHELPIMLQCSWVCFDSWLILLEIFCFCVFEQQGLLLSKHVCECDVYANC